MNHVVHNEEIIYYNTFYNGSYNLDQKAYETSFENAYKEIINDYTSEENNLFKNLIIPTVIVDQLKTKLSGFIQLSYEDILSRVVNLVDITEFEMLNVSYSLIDITFDALYESKKKIIR